MSEGKYTAGVLAGIRNDAAVAASGRLFPWPAELPGLGPRQLIAIDVCLDCPAGIHVCASSTWVAYGPNVAERRPLCLPCAKRRADAGAQSQGAGGVPTIRPGLERPPAPLVLPDEVEG